MSELLKALENGTRTFIKSPVLLFGMLGLAVVLKVLADRVQDN